jgi:hypothetical protein
LVITTLLLKEKRKKNTLAPLGARKDVPRKYEEVKGKNGKRCRIPAINAKNLF